MGIFPAMADAVADANARARELSLKRPTQLIMAVVTKDKYGVFISWPTVEQIMAANDVECGWWKDGKNMKGREGK